MADIRYRLAVGGEGRDRFGAGRRRDEFLLAALERNHEQVFAKGVQVRIFGAVGVKGDQFAVGGNAGCKIVPFAAGDFPKLFFIEVKSVNLESVVGKITKPVEAEIQPCDVAENGRFFLFLLVLDEMRIVVAQVEYEAAAIRRPLKSRDGAVKLHHFSLGPTLDRDDVDRRLFVSGRNEGNLHAIGRPYRLAIVIVTVGELLRLLGGEVINEQIAEILVCLFVHSLDSVGNSSLIGGYRHGCWQAQFEEVFRLNASFLDWFSGLGWHFHTLPVSK